MITRTEALRRSVGVRGAQLSPARFRRERHASAKVRQPDFIHMPKCALGAQSVESSCVLGYAVPTYPRGDWMSDMSFLTAGMEYLAKSQDLRSTIERLVRLAANA